MLSLCTNKNALEVNLGGTDLKGTYYLVDVLKIIFRVVINFIIIAQFY